jgi:AraC-like DNA-binding protein
VAHIEAHLAESLYVPSLAAMSGLSESAFSRLFKKCTGRTVPQYVNELRIARACLLLAGTDDTVGEIANACGYHTPAHFQRQFRKHQKRSPQVYRHAVRRHG